MTRVKFNNIEYSVDEECISACTKLLRESDTNLTRRVMQDAKKIFEEEYGKDYNNVKAYHDFVTSPREGYIEIKLPIANKEWSFAVFNTVLRICRMYPKCFPSHSTSKPNHIGIQVQE